MSDVSGANCQQHTLHKKKFSGGKFKKERLSKKKERHNPKAFTFSGGVKSVQRKAQYALDHETKRLHANLIPNKISEDLPPPIVVAVQGPPNVGKTTLIQSLVKHYTRLNVSSIKGPITLVAGKKRRLTFIECPSDAASMLDVAKIADIVLLLIDGHFGFEMETFEFLSILQATGFPKVIGVLTHLDLLHDAHALKKAKKKLKSRFWAEIYHGAKLFYLSELRFDHYNKREILNLSRFIAVQGLRPLEFRSQRPYVVALRFEEQLPTIAANSTTQGRTVHFYGYVNGATLRAGTALHIPGAGDFVAANVTSYTDPCPLPIARTSKNESSKNLRTLKMDQRRVYAPDSGIGHVNFDEDALYINLPQHQIGFTAKNNSSLVKDQDLSTDISSKDESINELPEPVALVRQLQTASEKLNEQVETLKLRLMSESKTLLKNVVHQRRAVPNFNFFSNSNEDNGNFSDSDNSNFNNSDNPNFSNLDNRNSSDLDHRSLCDMYASNSINSAHDMFWRDSSSIIQSNSDHEHDKISESTHRNALGHRTNWMPDMRAPVRKNSLSNIIYASHEIVNLNHKALEKNESVPLFQNDLVDVKNDLLVTPDEAHSNISSLLGECHPRIAQQDESELLSDFGLYHIFLNKTPPNSDSLNGLVLLMTSKAHYELKKRHFITGGWSEPSLSTSQTENHTKEEAKQQEEEEMKQSEKDNFFQEKSKKDAEDRQRIYETHQFLKNNESGLTIGTYCRVVVNDIPSLWIDHLKKVPHLVLLGGLLPNECGSFGYLRTRIKKHRWAPKVLKTEDPLLISIGWRRFQSLPIYCIDDVNHSRTRYLKYTPEHMHCLAVFYGPYSPPNTGLVALRNWSPNISHFRISATGVVLEVGKNFPILKKLKLVGEPLKIFKNTAFIKNMFNSDLEVAKCIGSKIQTVAGIRGQIKKAHGHEGVFRATFEDKILMSDIVICKTWIRVQPKRFCNPLLDIPTWRRLRNLVEIRHALGIPQPNSSQSEYGPRQEREERRFNPLHIPKDIQKNLPFKSLPKDTLRQKQAKGLLALVTKPSLSPYEKKVITVLQRLHLIEKQRHLQRKKAALEHKAKLQKDNEKMLKVKSFAMRDKKKRICAVKSIQRQKILRRLGIEE